MNKFKFAKEKAFKNFINKIKEINYWEKVYKKFLIHKKRKDEEFQMSFSHNIFSSFVKDDELRIDAYAKECGYEIKDEYLTTKSSIYIFKKID